MAKARLTAKERRALQARQRLPQLADEFGKLREEIKTLQEKEKTLKEEILELVPVGEKAEGEKYSVTVHESSRVEYDTEAIVKMLPKTKLAQVVKITSNIKQFVLPEKLDKLSTVTKEIRIRVSKK